MGQTSVLEGEAGKGTFLSNKQGTTPQESGRHSIWRRKRGVGLRKNIKIHQGGGGGEKKKKNAEEKGSPQLFLK